MAATEVRRTFRAAHRDIEVIIRDDFGIERPSYIFLDNGPVDVNAVIVGLIAETQAQTDAILAALEGTGIEP